MVEKTPDDTANKNPTEEGKKVELAIIPKQLPESEIVDEEDLAEESKGEVVMVKKPKNRADLADQSKSNLPICPDKEDLMELLEANLKKLKIAPDQAQKLREVLASGQDAFEKAFDEVIEELKKKKQREK